MEILKVDTEKRRLGDFGEAEAAKFLRKNGYRILERNYVAMEHEVDIIAEDKYAVAFVEVKTRRLDRLSPMEPRPASSVTREKQRSIIAAAKCYIAYHPPTKHVRLDIIEVYVSEEGGKLKVAEIKHLKGAFDSNTAYKRR